MNKTYHNISFSVSRFFIRFFAIGIVLSFLSGCSTLTSWLPDKIDETKDWTVVQLYTEAKVNLKEGEYDLAIDLYEKITARFPHGQYALQAQIDLSYAHYKNNDPEFALAEIKRFIKVNPKHPNVDYMYYLRGLSVFPARKSVFEFIWPQDESKRGSKLSLESFQYFDLLVRKFPDSLYTDDAKMRMRYLRNKVAKHELHIAKFYYEHEAYVAAINRASYVIKNLQETPAVGDALLIKIKAYKKLKLDKLAQDTQKVYDLNKVKAGFVENVFLEDESIFADFIPDWLIPPEWLMP